MIALPEPPPPARPPLHHRPPLGLPTRLAVLTAVMSLLLVLGATETALSISERSRLDDLRDASVAMANTLAAFLTRIAPTGNPDGLRAGLANWSRRHIVETTAWVFVSQAGHFELAASSDSLNDALPVAADSEAARTRQTVVQYLGGDEKGWRVAMPIGTPDPYGVLDVSVATRRLDEWADRERQLAYALALAASLLVALGVFLLTARWVGRPLTSLGRAMALAHSGAEGSPAAPELGPQEFRELARQYNQLRTALARRERESDASASLRALEERARSLDRLAMMQETAAGFAHEIGTPLNTMSGHLQLLREDLRRAGNQPAGERVNLMLSQLGRVAQIVRAGLERGGWPSPAVQPIELDAVARRVLRFLDPTLQESGIRATVVAAPSGGSILAQGDSAMVEQILLNLLKNAVEAMGHGGSISVSVSSLNGTAAIEVADDGPGLTPEAQSQLFKPFTTTKGPAGTGLGLSVSRRLARSLGGDLVHVPSERGARWRLTLPLTAKS